MLFLRHFGASKIVLTKARLLKHDFPVHGNTCVPNGYDFKSNAVTVTASILKNNSPTTNFACVDLGPDYRAFELAFTYCI